MAPPSVGGAIACRARAMWHPRRGLANPWRRLWAVTRVATAMGRGAAFAASSRFPSEARRGAPLPWVWAAAALAGVATGVAAALSWPLALGSSAVLLVVYAFVRSGVWAEVVVALYWLAFSVYQTILADAAITIEGFFYPFYASFALTVAIALARGRLRLDPRTAWLYVSFLVVVLGSFVGFDRPVDFFVIQRVFAYVFGFLLLLQVGSRTGLAPIATAAAGTGLVLSGWVIGNAAAGGFDYRGDIDADPNLTAFIVGLGIVTVLARLAFGTDGRPLARTGLLLLLGVMVYASLLLASRGMFIALGLATLVVLARVTVQAPRRLLWLALIVPLAAAAMLLPGGASLVERFEGESVETGGSRTPIWEMTLEAFTTGSPLAVMLGRGFKSSETVVQQRYGYLTSVHNAYLQVLYEFGIVGLSLFLALHARLVRIAWRLGNAYGGMALGMVAMLLGANLSADAPDGFMYWTALGFVAAACLWGARPNGAAT